jgi:hypothetical protein
VIQLCNFIYDLVLFAIFYTASILLMSNVVHPYLLGSQLDFIQASVFQTFNVILTFTNSSFVWSDLGLARRLLCVRLHVF